MGIGELRCVVINVTDLAVAYRFWSAVTGLEIIGSPDGWHGWLGYLGTKDPWKHEIILQRTDNAPVEVATPSHDTTNAVHIDITPNSGIDSAIEEIVALGGSVKKPPSLYPRPGSHKDHRPLIDWAVMQDPCWERVLLWSTSSPRNSHTPPWPADATTDQEWSGRLRGQTRS